MSIFNADPSQFQLTETGIILFQKTVNNPTLGEKIAKIVKGETIYTPQIDLVESSYLKQGERENKEIIDPLAQWLSSHVRTVLEPLTRLEDTQILHKKEGSEELVPMEFSQDSHEQAKAIMDKLYDHMGVIHRSVLEDDIQKLDEDARRILRAKRVKLGPILVFLPELNKPKGVRLRGLLWSIWHDQPLPAPLPVDGAVSVQVDPETINKDLYSAVSYPIFGDRAVRIDMLDRVVNAIYENAKEGKFQAQHAMAEWLGCSIEALYTILSSMGHTRIVNDDPTEETEEGEKPALNFFWLKKGQAHKARPHKPKRKTKEKKSFKKGKSKKDHVPRVLSAEADKNPDDNPFAILGSLKS